MTELILRWRRLRAITDTFVDARWTPCPECKHAKHPSGGSNREELDAFYAAKKACACVCHWEWCDTCGAPSRRRACRPARRYPR